MTKNLFFHVAVCGEEKNFQMERTEKSGKWREVLTDIGFLFAGGLLFGVAYNMFLVPGEIYIGGSGGIATALNVLYGLPTGTMIFLINVPLMLLFMRFYGLRASVKGIIGILVSSVFVDVTALLNLFPPAFKVEDSLLNAIFGGIVIGVALGLMFTRGYTTGGSDLAALLIKLKFGKLPTAKLILAIDAAVVVFAAVITRSYVSILYSFLAIFMSSNALEMVTGGFDKTRIAYIFSEKYEKIADALTNDLERGVTLLDGMGWYTKDSKKVIFCVVKKNEIYSLKTLVRAIDPAAFMILGEATETIGLGFKTGVGDVAIEPKKREKEK